ncbi:hypothetical protein P3X46_029660 [Hevea brasiliensis]|uniref:Uncharacterized protein n=1 Tax=Hevea brasiliensis TaxID=3981 RepID=A0ABQ9KT08_HEVBR|nr:hypothetical protein P3X46_029660 [Hevea brasiliensis]
MKAFLIICVLLSSFFVIPSPIVARKLTHNGEKLNLSNGKVGCRKLEGVKEGPVCKGKRKGNCRCPVFKPNC